MAEKKKLSDFVCITTPDRLHKDCAIAFIKQGYHVLLEKPMAVSSCCFHYSVAFSVRQVAPTHEGSSIRNEFSQSHCF